MLEHTEFDPTDKGTLRLDAPLISKLGDTFYLINLPPFALIVRLLDSINPDDPIALFTIYYTPEIVNIIIENTNAYIRELINVLLSYTRVLT